MKPLYVLFYILIILPKKSYIFYNRYEYILIILSKKSYTFYNMYEYILILC